MRCPPCPEVRLRALRRWSTPGRRRCKPLRLRRAWHWTSLGTSCRPIIREPFELTSIVHSAALANSGAEGVPPAAACNTAASAVQAVSSATIATQQAALPVAQFVPLLDLVTR